MDSIQRRRRLRRKTGRNNDSFLYNEPSESPIGQSISDSPKIASNETANWPEIVSTALTPETPKIGARLRLEATINGEPQCVLWLKVTSLFFDTKSTHFSP